ncbi:type I-E CRISPR-associated protein Cas5/CasD [Chromobacterium subtsugae]|uniref:Type I-E CRISPR-associated protein Cas5/CasD n=1 Tax=Chromobacterium subtsugae TaxID=251747 RepID=A0ABS7F9X4_9NEIS|nr:MULTISPECIES: type I-E CRISPR-associated protein Cas5/CasD [Chromobacterium]KUM02495.1 type I-E CRISPR-associated protein Cas5/CasD [Chromobacterium subtsugae]KZE87880.1 type I-E CRISPR-associated protein Cas5/CasD [Chromobacterium sp. F49]MBW7565372.1 type I-E CRISPR-associated protein Cas5/CasD [Chromobacterium subtsugae]MBW8286777.1 type I-E CRISPR-associated protein Cas5/CasD [Chromobacterium subtsugae]WSE90746.1 type I-E CRISPR-associated protein Cas5/CasD [Chromobacterium subtsugae]
MATLLLRLAGPMQAWGTTSRFDERDSGLEPSKSGVLGLVCAALGRDRSEPLDDLATLKMSVRVDREGLLMRDYQTLGGDRDPEKVKKSIRTASGGFKKDPVISPRYYLADAAFLVALEGEHRLLATMQQALQRPVWPLSLGRKSMPPGLPVWLPEGIQDETAQKVLSSWPRIAPCRAEHKGQPLRLMSEHPSEGAVRLDQPAAPFAERRFGPRFVKPEVVDVPDTTEA